eukprot:TRINITY_DN79231_c0_g1_i1.p1 TRINITY_DN79231_c0_g1~~TRINITY_DN79231_c0_g1_i1.p1  ORF type:complete len:286 (+),score=49.59 TRINITY_DN79231_c0_g1_i1:249-1106(+)
MAVQHLQLLLLLISDAVHKGRSAVPECVLNGQGYEDPAVKALNGGAPEDAASCQKLCAEDAHCAFFTFFNDSHGCWLLGKEATIRDPAESWDAFAVSGPKVCKGADETSDSSQEQAVWEEPTVAPGIQITPTGVAQVAFGASPNVTVNDSSRVSQDLGITRPEPNTSKYFGVDWFWFLFGGAGVAAFCICMTCAFRQQLPKSEPKGRSIAVAKEMPRAEMAEAEASPLIQGLQRPQLQVPQLAQATLVPPQLISVPASYARSPVLMPQAPMPQATYLQQPAVRYA